MMVAVENIRIFQNESVKIIGNIHFVSMSIRIDIGAKS